MNYTKPDMAVIVPILNEAAELPGLLSSLSAQENVRIELFLCDGGSNDTSRQIVSGFADELDFPVRLIRAESGRGRQMNAGAAVATSELLLFLHADSRFDDRSALCKAVAAYRRQVAGGTNMFAARFRLNFRRSEQSASLAWFYYEAKAQLSRHDCLRGDQGFLLNRAAFSAAGGFDESLPFLEDIRLVEALPSELEWLLLPAVISSSARRFENEGLLERQILNAIIVNSIATGWTEFFHELPGIYRCHADTGRLLLFPLLKSIESLISAHDRGWQQNFWQETGRHVAGNAWQLFFWMDVRHAFKAGKSAAEVESRCLNFYHRRLEPIFLGRLAANLAKNLVKLWLRWMLFKGTNRTVLLPAP